MKRLAIKAKTWWALEFPEGGYLTDIWGVRLYPSEQAARSMIGRALGSASCEPTPVEIVKCQNKD